MALAGGIVPALRRRLQAWARPRRPEALPVVLDRRRIYVLPTRFGLFVATLLATMLLGALNYNNNPALLLALLLAAVAVASTVAAHLQLSGLRVEAATAEPVAAGRDLHLRLSLACTDARPRRGLRLDCDGREAWCGLDPGTPRAEPELALPTATRGWYPLARLRLSTTRPLGLVRAWSWVWPDAALLVYPAPEPDGPPLPEGSGGRQQMRLHALGEDLHQLRPYRAGDAPRAIAWKHSARRDVLLVREYERPVGEDIVLDWRALAALPHERRIARLARWIDLAERSGRRYRLLIPGHPPLGPDRGPQQRHLCLRALALMPYADGQA
ncbi:DUF58 domain-containing protein [Xanthomonas massiliensis]|uniref:DUF58 domain-containing protein n=1 Tax=Xanthomonas massiliensis TaxID=1720302 RepID=UPI0008262E73|nr:DUF58 domain-containing protein [Xanthomonas massiliensis]